MSIHNVERNLNLAAGDALTLTDFGASGMKADVIAESTSATGVTVDDTPFKDGGVITASDQDLTTGSSGDVQLGSAGHVLLPDSSNVRFGDSTDNNVSWDGSKLVSGPTGLWLGAPSPLDPDPFKAITLFDDFLTGVDTGTHWAELWDQVSTGTNTHGDVRGGTLNVLTDAVDDDYHAMQSMAECFDFAGTKELWFEARFRVAEGATNQSTWWFGLSNTDTTGGMQTAGSGPLASYDGVLIYKIEGAMAIDVETSNAGSQDIETNIATVVHNTWTRVGFYVSAAAGSAVIRAYSAVNDATSLSPHAFTMVLTRSGMEPMHVVFGIKSGGSVETLEVDYVKCVQLR